MPTSGGAARCISRQEQVDNFTRVSHAHGLEFAAALWRFGDAAYDALVAYCQATGVAYRTQKPPPTDHERA